MSTTKHTPGPWTWAYTKQYDRPGTPAREPRAENTTVRIRTETERIADVEYHSVDTGEPLFPGSQATRKRLDYDKTEANARRIVAAVNACEGIPTEALEAGVVKDLLEALEDAKHMLVQYQTALAQISRRKVTAASVREKLHPVVHRLRAAIRRATGEEA